MIENGGEGLRPQTDGWLNRTLAATDALDAAGIEVPFPQTDVRLRSLFGREGEDAIQALGLGQDGKRMVRPNRAEDRHAPQETTNDAAEELLTPPDFTDDDGASSGGIRSRI